MNEIDTDTLDLMISVRAAINAGKLVEYKNNPRFKGLPTEWTLVDADHKWNFEAFDYRIKPLEFPKLPGHPQWHNPDNLTPEQVGPDRRLLVKGELDGRFSSGSNEHQVSWWIGGQWKTTNGIVGATGSYNTYSVPVSTPFPEPLKPKLMVPLEPHDISPTDVLRKKDRKDFYAEHWMKIDAVNSDGPAVHFSGSGRIRIPFKTLMNEWEISRDGAKTWSPCEKESES